MADVPATGSDVTTHEDIMNALQRLMEACDDIRVCDTTPSKQHADYVAARQNAWLALAAARGVP